MPLINHPNEWHLDLCKVGEAWALPLSRPGGKSKGEGIIIVHPDTGWTKHPEIIHGGRYLINDYKVSRNFMVNVPTDNDAYWNHPDNSPEWRKNGVFPKDRLAQDWLEPFLISGRYTPSHGTTTAGTMISGEGHPNFWFNEYPDYKIPTNEYVTGIAPKAELIPCKVCKTVVLGVSVNSNWIGYTPDALAKAIQHACDLSRQNRYRNIGVINISMGSSDKCKPLENALIRARWEGIIVCAAAGQAMLPLDPYKSDLISWHAENAVENAGPIYPAGSKYVICVAGCTRDFKKPPYGGFYGRYVTVTAPAWNIPIARSLAKGWKAVVAGAMDPTLMIPFTEYTIEHTGNGTSHAAALVSGACALWQAYHGRDFLIGKYTKPLLPSLFKYCLQKSVQFPKDQLWHLDKRGSGVLNVEELLKINLNDISYEFVKDLAVKEGLA